MFLFFLKTNSYANWLCKEASSYQQGDTFYACGHAVEPTLSKARESSLNAAKREFDFFCNESHSCKNKAYNIKPMRTDCNKEPKGYSCYRGLEFIILDKDRVIYVNRDEFKGKLKTLEKKVDKLYSKIDSKEPNKDIQEEGNSLNLDAYEVELADIESKKSYKIKNVAKPSAFSLVLGQTGVYFKGDNQPLDQNKMLTTFGIEYNKRIWNGISFRSQLLIHDSFDSSTDEDKIKKTYNKDIYHSYNALDLNIGVSVLTNYGFIIPHFGTISSTYNYTRNDIVHPSGVVTKEAEYKQSSTYAGVGWRYGERYFIEVSPRYYLGYKEFSGSVSIGLNFGY